jgi:hypothetical protein
MVTSRGHALERDRADVREYIQRSKVVSIRGLQELVAKYELYYTEFVEEQQG